MNAELQVKIQEWRRKAAAGEMTTDEYREVIEALREGRAAAATTSATSRSKKKLPVDSNRLLDELEGL